jgi:type III secretory pathway component EscV
MKTPARIFTNLQDTHYIGHMGMWSNKEGVESTEYIRRDVVGRAMWRLMADWKHFIHADTIDKYIEDAIKDADNADND